ncbi:gliding motility-associated C-terminal domain-containing protein [Myroides albus]|uniref:T9SS type B sorting domain-containing protein n=1 Tax=Myroides albus TaxID=2562892 RepID=A0A6I3LLZ8_9FLAO|nr:gliding motility-associated C-terminal domain-containing protein [Myroides albus]MTG99393.1 T9SS type B sorting domain-containing protein [Myroides albus]UVD79101.1 gliding motility-associated C-terminal domain-containing protein [Myroides albus]
MNNLKNKILFCSLIAFSICFKGRAQDNIISNHGILKVANHGILTNYLSFYNHTSASIQNDGNLYFFNDYRNDGIHSFDKELKNSRTIFSNINQVNKKPQNIDGVGLTELNNVIFSNSTSDFAFFIQASLDLYGLVDFQEGILKIQQASVDNKLEYSGAVSFHDGSKIQNVSNVSYVDGFVEKVGQQEITFPIGNGNYYRYARISASESNKNIFQSKYKVDDNQFFNIRNNVSGVINKLNEKEYWVIEKSKNSNNTDDIILTLTWDERTTPGELLKDPVRELHIVRWDEKLQIWVDEGGIVDVDTKSISTPTSVKGYGFFTLATVNKDWLLDGDVVIYNLVSANGDGKNDFFRIDNIERFPNNTVEIFNRWGVRVYETTNYNSRGNVFVGKSDGRGTISKGESLPTGTYYYVITYEYKDDKGSRTIKKAGYLHLETN